jgi:thymidylate kinase
VIDASDRALIEAVPDSARAVHGVPDPGTAEARERVAASIAQLVEGQPQVRVSPLGPGWSSDIDVHVAQLPPPGPLQAAGWRRLDPLLARIGSPARNRWAVTEAGRLVGAVDLTTGPAPSPLDGLVSRARRRGEVRLREVLELRVLAREGVDLDGAGGELLASAAALELGLGGDQLARFRDGRPPTVNPVPLAGGGVGATLRSAAGAARRTLRPRVVVALSGVDGSGKSSLAADVVSQLGAVGIPASVVWTRPGMRVGALSWLARAGRRVLRQGKEPGVRAVAAGDADLPSRRGPVGLAWSVLVAVAFAADVRRRHASARGVVVYDRHLLDALVTLDFVYAGVDLRLARAICRAALPRADLSFYVAVPAEVAVARKPGDTFGEHAVARQLAGYADRLASVRDIEVLDATRPTAELAAIVLDRLLPAP